MFTSCLHRQLWNDTTLGGMPHPLLVDMSRTSQNDVDRNDSKAGLSQEWRTRVEEVFNQVADLSADARKTYFAEHNIAPGTRIDVEELLHFDSGSNTSLQTQISLLAEQAL